MIIVTKTGCDKRASSRKEKCRDKERPCPGFRSDRQAVKGTYCDKVNITSMGAITSTG
jgi:hypothetical protein